MGSCVPGSAPVLPRGASPMHLLRKTPAYPRKKATSRYSENRPASVPVRPRLSCLSVSLAPWGKPGAFRQRIPLSSEAPGCGHVGVSRAGAHSALRRLGPDFLCGCSPPAECRGRRPPGSLPSEPPSGGAFAQSTAHFHAPCADTQARPEPPCPVSMRPNHAASRQPWHEHC